MIKKLPLINWTKEQELRKKLKPILWPYLQLARRGISFVRKYYRDSHEIVFWNGGKLNTDNEAIGLYNYGSCHLQAVGFIEPYFKNNYKGSVGIYYEGWNASQARTDIMLQSTKKLPTEVTSEIMEKLRLEPGYFYSNLAETNFEAKTPVGKKEFRKDVVFLSVASDVVRTVYRHKESGVLVDPGGWWLNQDIGKVLEDLDTARWFRKNFEKLGRLTAEESMDNFRKIIALIRQKTDAQIIMLNLPVVSPSDLSYNYQLLRNPETVRRREFNLAAEDLAQELDFMMIDVDNIIKRGGFHDKQVDFAHWPDEEYQPVAKEIYAALEEIGVFKGLEKLN